MPEYDEDAFLKADTKIADAVNAMFDAGCDKADVMASVKNAIQEATE